MCVCVVIGFVVYTLYTINEATVDRDGHENNIASIICTCKFGIFGTYKNAVYHHMCTQKS